jgi:ribosomal protein S27AE
MDNDAQLTCERCGETTVLAIAEDRRETDVVTCSSCGAGLATVGQLHARFAQQALGLGATDLRDDHVPVDGELGERPNV